MDDFARKMDEIQRSVDRRQRRWRFLGWLAIVVAASPVVLPVIAVSWALVFHGQASKTTQATTSLSQASAQLLTISKRLEALTRDEMAPLITDRSCWRVDCSARYDALVEKYNTVAETLKSMKVPECLADGRKHIIAGLSYRVEWLARTSAYLFDSAFKVDNSLHDKSIAEFDLATAAIKKSKTTCLTAM